MDSLIPVVIVAVLIKQLALLKLQRPVRTEPVDERRTADGFRVFCREHGPSAALGDRRPHQLAADRGHPAAAVDVQ